MDPLLYRRQFLLARQPVPELDGWQRLSIGGLWLHSHPDLQVAEQTDGTRTLILLGYLFDAQAPEKQNRDILADIVRSTRSFNDAVLALKPYAGQYVLIYHDTSDFRLLPDALALREVYYCNGQNRVVAGSQPNFLAACSEPKIEITRDPEVAAFYQQHMPGVRERRLWAGDGTYYDSIKHLLPNHCLNLNTQVVTRYWPNTPLPKLSLDEVVDRACRFLQGMLRAATHRHSAMMAVTSGTDSRTLLAASRAVSDRIHYFINHRGQFHRRSADLVIPQRIFQRINLPFHVHQVPGRVDPDFRKTFLQNTFLASEKLLPTIYNVYYKKHGDKINLLGVGEIGRALWGLEPKELNAYYLAYSMHYKNSTYATRQCDAWLQEVRPVARDYGLDIMTLLLWEQLLGNWGSVGNSESDIAIEEFDPYNSHYMYETLLGVEASLKKNPQLVFREMLRRMWPELLEFPINPPDSFADWASLVLQRLRIYPALKKLRYQLNYSRYRRLTAAR
jgi:hypothetical protein